MPVRFKTTLEDYRVRQRAYAAVNYAIKHHRLPAVTTQRCVDCGQSATQYHHHLGYAPEHRLHVQPVCVAHHHSRERATHHKMALEMETAMATEPGVPTPAPGPPHTGESE